MKRPEPRRRRLFAAGLVGLVVLGASVVLPTPGTPSASAEVLSSSVTLASDGTGQGTGSQCQVKDPGSVFADATAHDGVVCTNDTVTYAWDFNLDAGGAQGATFVQTLPVGWTWDSISAVACQGNGTDFTGTGVITDGGRTLTCVLDAPPGDSTASLQIPVVAKPGGNVANLSTYTAELTMTEGANPAQVSTAAPVTVRAAPTFELHKTVTGGQGFRPNTDFGNGPEDGYYLDFTTWIDIPGSANTKGLEPLASPFTFTDVLAGVSPNAIVTNISSPSSGTPTFVQPGGPGSPVQVTVTGANTLGANGSIATNLSASTVWRATIRVVVPASEVPAAPVGKDIVNQLNGFDPDGIYGSSNFGPGYEQGSEPGANCDRLIDPAFGVPNNNCAKGHLNGFTVTPGTGPSSTKDIYQAAPNGVPCAPATGDILACPRLPGETGSENGYALPGTRVWARQYTHPGTLVGGANRTVQNFMICDKWNPALQTIDPSVPTRVGYPTPLPSGDVVLQYTNQTYADDAARANTSCGVPSDTTTNGPWFASIAEAGGPAAVTGVRATYTGNGGLWPGGHFLMSVPMIAGDVLGPVPDFYGYRWDERVTGANPTGFTNAARDGYRVTDQFLSLDKDTAPTGVIATTTGSTVNFTLKPTVTEPGSPAPEPTTGLTVVDTLDTCMLAPTLNASSTQWTMAVTAADVGPDGLPCTGDDVSGAVLTFTHTAPSVLPNQPIEPIAYAIVVSPLVQNGRSIHNTAVVTADGNQQPAPPRTDAWTLQVAAPGAVRVLKTADFPKVEINPDELAWTATWSNTLNSPDTAGVTTFIDVLPFNGDGRGTSFDGTFNLKAVTQLGSFADVTLMYTGAAPATINPDANLNTSTWCLPADFGTAGCPADLGAVTGLRAVDADFVKGEVGGLHIVAAPIGNLDGDVYFNNVGLGRATNLGQPIPATPPAKIVVVSSSVGDRVWMDLDADGVQDSGEPGIPGVTLVLFDGQGTQLATTVTGTDGLYTFAGYHSGSYRVAIDESTLPPGVVPTYDLDGGTTSPDNDSGVFALGIEADRTDVDFGLVTPRIDVAKTVTSGPTANGDGTYDITYAIDVTNAGAVATTYDLTDELRFSPGITPSSATVTNTQPGDIATGATWNGVDDTAVVSGQPIAVGVTHTYSVTVTASVPAELSVTEADCTLAQGEIGTGLRNEVTVTHDGVEVDDDACAVLPVVSITKDVQPLTAVGDGTFDLTYDVTVSNDGVVDTTYTLADELQLGAGVTITPGSVAVANTTPGTIVTLADFDGVAHTAIVGSTPLAAGTDHVYRVTVNVTVAVDITQADGDCSLGEGETGTGGLNSATLTHNGVDESDTACVPLGVVSMSKSLAGDPEPNGDGTYTITYDLTVTNSGARDNTYDLDDALAYGDGITIDTATVTAPGGITANPAWDGTSTTSVVEDEAIVGNASHVYRVTVIATPGTTTVGGATDCVVATGEVGTGFLNTATLVSDLVTRTDEACAPVPAIRVHKELIGDPVPNGDGSYTLTYRITVDNEGAGPGIYTVEDALAYGEGIDVASAQVTNTAPGTIVTDPNWDGIDDTVVVADQELAGDATDTYTVTVVATPPVVADQGAEDCIVGSKDRGSGYLNTATLTSNGTDETAEACVGVARLDFTKEVVGTPTADADHVATVHYDLTVTNSGSGPDAYSLSDDLAFGGGIVIRSATVANAVPGSIVTNPSWDGAGDIEVATDVVIGAGETHVYRVTVTAQVWTALTSMVTDCAIETTEEGSGFLNVGEITVNSHSIERTACASAEVLSTGVTTTPDASVLAATTTAKGSLPVTGSDALRLVLLALGLIGAGVLLVITRRRGNAS